MSSDLPETLRAELAATAAARRGGGRRLTVRQAGGGAYPLSRFSRRGFAVDPALTPALRGMVDILEGTTLLFRALVVTAGEEAGERRYEFKQLTAVQDTPPLDHVRDEAPAAGALPPPLPDA